MTASFDASAQPPGCNHRVELIAPFLGASTLTYLKPRLKVLVRPAAAKLAIAGVTANHVTLISLAGSIAIGTVLLANPDNLVLFALLPLWLPMRMACAALDGTLAVEFGQKSRIGGILNEVGDIVADLALFLPLAFVAPFSVKSIVLLATLIVMAEIVGIIGPQFGSGRRLEGPFGKSDRSIVLALLGLVIVAHGTLPVYPLLPALLNAGLILTIWNRLRFAIVDGSKASE